ncbi:trypsin-like [Hemicordylus capensis]|uniref:trypsin-like n=1 Tax=Hemicordylus capensis TaxID=884348 RepID=UPI002302D14E|nr:trypsin-like [Hemicordylus capensis]
MEVWLGTPEETPQVISAAKVIPHERFNNYTLDFDIMLLKLTQPAALNGCVQPISLPQQCAAAGTLCLTSEWGSNNLNRRDGPLQCSNLTIASNAMCNNAYPGRFTERMLCAGQLDGGQDSCKGDVGSPLVCGDALQGLLSWNNSCSEENQLGLYTKICAFGAWIHYTITNN